MTLHLGQIFFTEARTFMFNSLLMACSPSAFRSSLPYEGVIELAFNSFENVFTRRWVVWSRLDRFSIADLHRTLRAELFIVGLILIALDLKNRVEGYRDNDE